MRRKEKQVTEISEILKIIDKIKYCRLAVSRDNRPYIIPLNFGYEYKEETLTLYFHSARKGKKLDILFENPHACFEMDIDHGLVTGDLACEYGYAFESIIGTGKVTFIEDNDQKQKALTHLMNHQTDTRKVYQFPPQHLNAVTIYKLESSDFTCKRSGIS